MLENITPQINNNSQEEIPIKMEEKRNPDGTFALGHSGGPGRPKGQSLKEFWRQRFQEMTNEEKVAFAAKVGNDVVWKMAEGNPKNDVEHSGSLTIAQVLKEIENESTQGQTVEIAESIQDTGQEEKPHDIPAEQSPAALQPPQVVEKYNPQE